MLGLFLFLGNVEPALSETTTRVLKDLAYDTVGNETLDLDLYLPEKSVLTPTPVVVLIHGGCFSEGDKSDHESEAQDLVKLGYIAASVNYQLVPQTRYPASLRDVQQAVRWLRQNAKTYNINPEAVAVIGFSAGGYLASMLGVQPLGDRAGLLDSFSKRVTGVIDFYGRTDFLRPEPSGGFDCAQYYLGSERTNNPEKYKEASVLTYVNPESSPFVILHGDADQQVELYHSIKLDKILKLSHVHSKLVLLPGEGHGFTWKSAPQAWIEVRNFLSEVVPVPGILQSMAIQLRQFTLAAESSFLGLRDFLWARGSRSPGAIAPSGKAHRLDK